MYSVFIFSVAIVIVSSSSSSACARQQSKETFFKELSENGFTQRFDDERDYIKNDQGIELISSILNTNVNNNKRLKSHDFFMGIMLFQGNNYYDLFYICNIY